MTVGVDCGGRKIAVVSMDAGIYAVYELKKIDFPRFYREAPLWLEMYRKVLADEKWYMEAPIVAGARNLQATIKIAQCTGLVRAVVPDIEEVAVASWKKATVGHGHASKQQVREWLDEHYPEAARMCRGNQDLYDAACISISGRPRR